MSALRRAIATLAEEFASQVLAALRTASIGDFASLSIGSAPRRGPGRPPKNPGAAPSPRGRRRRRTSADLNALGDKIVATVRANPKGMRAEQIRAALKIAQKELPRAITQLLSTGALEKQGQRRATTYFAGGGGTASKASGKKRGRPKKKG
jgi:hypothetical protein